MTSGAGPLGLEGEGGAWLRLPLPADEREDHHVCDPEPSSRAGLEGVRWMRSYDRASVERFLAEVDVERTRLVEEICATRARVAEAERRREQEQSDAVAALGALVLAAQAELEAIEREHDDLVAGIREAAELEAERLLSAARAEAEAVRRAAGALADLVRRDGGDGSAPGEGFGPAQVNGTGAAARFDAG